ncbi:MAG: hypothetical protein BWY09_02046 [Candidatus Hydrogenedentes bacterium ADurb.Bin179]|nr:MAG: hypothetical protein BWY09_02046 [Candidatus Hydrogenedentes bacterium ADurb.Bin179]
MGIGAASTPKTHTRPAHRTLSLTVNIAGGRTFGLRRFITVSGYGRLGFDTIHGIAIGAGRGSGRRENRVALAAHCQSQDTFVGNRVKVVRNALIDEGQPRSHFLECLPGQVVNAGPFTHFHGIFSDMRYQEKVVDMGMGDKRNRQQRNIRGMYPCERRPLVSRGRK